MQGIKQILQNVPEKVRGWVYLSVFVVLFVGMVTLVVVDVVRGGDVQQWVGWVIGILGLGSAGLATANTNRHNG